MKKISISDKIAENFKNKYQKIDNGCWEWQRALDGGGYGILKNSQKRNFKAHRVAYYLAYGDFNERLLVLHKCDNPKCVNPDHLFLGTNKDNTRDMLNKNRHCFGERQHKSKLNEIQVLSIRDKFERLCAEIKNNLADEYGTSSSNINAIVSRTSWKHLRKESEGANANTNICTQE